MPLRIVRFLGRGISDYQDLPVEKGCAAARDALARHLVSRRSAWDIIDLREFDFSSGNLHPLRKSMENSGLVTKTEPDSVCSVIRISDDWETHYRCQFSTDRRKNHRREWRNLMKEGEIRVRKIVSLPMDSPLIAEIAETERRHSLFGHGRRGILNTGSYREFFEEFLPLASDKGWLIIFHLCCDGRIIGQTITFRYGDRNYMYETSYDRDFCRHSLGKHLIMVMLEDIWKNFTGTIDFLRGEETYKQYFTDEVRTNMRLTAWAKTLPACASAWIWSFLRGRRGKERPAAIAIPRSRRGSRTSRPDNKEPSTFMPPRTDSPY